MSEQPAPGATVLLQTYNHEKWIAQALDSVLMQQTSFPVELVVREDCSTDRTREIVLDYARRFPEAITLQLSERNTYSRAGWLQALRNAKGPYVALLDGDDYWTSAQKLQRQVDFLELHPECSMCVHNARVVWENGAGEEYDFVKPGRKPFSQVRDILMNNFIPTCGAMLRRDALEPMPPWLFTAKWDDWSLYIAAALRASIGYMDETMGVYRRHTGGVWSGLSRAQQVEGLIEFLEDMNAHLDHEHDAAIRVRIAELRTSVKEAQ